MRKETIMPDKNRCEKCGADRNSLHARNPKYVKPNTGERWNFHGYVLQSEALEYTCWRCGYQWYEPTRDAEKEHVR